MTAHTLADERWPEIAADLLVIPVGATEQHGPHLPLDVDSAVAEHVAADLVERACAARTRAVLGPTQRYGASVEHQDFPGTLSIGTEVLTALLLELCRSAARWTTRVVIVNGHGGNLDALAAVQAALCAEPVGELGEFGELEFGWVPCGVAVEGVDAATDLHAGRSETSLMLALRPETVRMTRAEAGPVEPFSRLIGRLRASGVRAVSPNGVLGDPAGASAAEGRSLCANLCNDAWARLEAWRPDAASGVLALPA